MYLDNWALSEQANRENLGREVQKQQEKYGESGEFGVIEGITGS